MYASDLAMVLIWFALQTLAVLVTVMGSTGSSLSWLLLRKHTHTNYTVVTVMTCLLKDGVCYPWRGVCQCLLDKVFGHSSPPVTAV